MRSFNPTQPRFDTVLPRVSDFQRRLRETAALGEGGDAGSPGNASTLQSSLDASLLQDLQRFEGPLRGGQGPEVLEVMAAAVRHGRALQVLLEHEGLVLPLTVRPQQRTVQAPLALEQWGLLRWAGLKVLQVEPAPPPVPAADLHDAPLGLVLWALALHGSRSELLPEIAGPVAYRIAPATELGSLDFAGALAPAIVRLQRQTTTLAELSRCAGFDRERAMRLLNGLYLQAGLMITRTHPAAVGALPAQRTHGPH